PGGCRGRRGSAESPAALRDLQSAQSLGASQGGPEPSSGDLSPVVRPQPRPRSPTGDVRPESRRPDGGRLNMAAREDILATVRAGQPASRELPQVPDFHQANGNLIGQFTAALALLDGKSLTQPPADLQRWLSETFPDASRICSAVPEVTGTVTP